MSLTSVHSEKMHSPARVTLKADPELHTLILGLMQELGYPVAGLLGVCEGFTNSGMKAFFEDEIENINATIAYIQETLLYADFKKVKKRLHSQNRHAATPGDQQLIDALDLLDEIAVHQTHRQESRLFNPADSSETLTKKQIEQKAGLFHHQLPNVPTYDEFTVYFNPLLTSIQTAEMPLAIKVEMGYSTHHSRTLLEAHAIGICYDPASKNFTLIDINQLPIKSDVASLDEISQFISNSIAILKRPITSFRSFLYATSPYRDALKPLAQTTLSNLNRTLSPESTIGLSYDQIEALKKLKTKGLTATHLRQWHSQKGFFSDRHTEALTHLMNLSLSPEKAVEELCDLEYFQAEALTRGLTKDEVIGLQGWQIISLEEFRNEGLTAAHLRQWKGGPFRALHNYALKRLFKERHLGPEEAIVELNKLNIDQ